MSGLEDSDDDNDPDNNPDMSTKQSVVTSSHKNSSSIKKKRKKNNKNQLLDDDTLSMLETSNVHSDNKMKEQVRHNHVMESIARKKDKREEARLEQESWKGKSDMLAFKVSLFNEYNKLLKTGMKKEQILLMFPEMQQVALANEMSNVNEKGDSE